MVLSFIGLPSYVRQNTFLFIWVLATSWSLMSSIGSFCCAQIPLVSFPFQTKTCFVFVFLVVLLLLSLCHFCLLPMFLLPLLLMLPASRASFVALPVVLLLIATSIFLRTSSCVHPSSRSESTGIDRDLLIHCLFVFLWSPFLFLSSSGSFCMHSCNCCTFLVVREHFALHSFFLIETSVVSSVGWCWLMLLLLCLLLLRVVCIFLMRDKHHMRTCPMRAKSSSFYWSVCLLRSQTCCHRVWHVDLRSTSRDCSLGRCPAKHVHWLKRDLWCTLSHDHTFPDVDVLNT